MSEPVSSSNPGPAVTQPPSLLPPSDGSWSHWIRSWVRDLAIALFIAGIIILFFYQPVKVEGTSMMPRLTDQERIFINKFVYRLENIHRGDVVVFWYPGDPTKSYIKRVIGLPGDTVEVHRGEVYVNGEMLDEPYILSEYRGSQSVRPTRVGAGEYYVLGDHRNSSNDSRVWGTLPRQFIYGKAELIYWPIDRWGLLE
ncbi:MAG: signal peptidase I [Acidobacteria bacterium]|nr:signal peptidase I [Acidobacteriota bacterium]